MRAIVEKLREAYPFGHPEFLPKTLAEIRLHSAKNHDYAGGAGQRPLGNFERGAAILALYPGLRMGRPSHYAAVLMLKQLDAMLNFLANGHAAHVEGLDERCQDISVYAKLISILAMEEAEPCDTSRSSEHAPAPTPNARKRSARRARNGTARPPVVTGSGTDGSRPFGELSARGS